MSRVWCFQALSRYHKRKVVALAQALVPERAGAVHASVMPRGAVPISGLRAGRAYFAGFALFWLTRPGTCGGCHAYWDATKGELCYYPEPADDPLGATRGTVISYACYGSYGTGPLPAKGRVCETPTTAAPIPEQGDSEAESVGVVVLWIVIVACVMCSCWCSCRRRPGPVYRY